jgi:hypothetical protein
LGYFEVPEELFGEFWDGVVFLEVLVGDFGMNFSLFLADLFDFVIFSVI